MLREERVRVVGYLGVDDRAPGLDVGGVPHQMLGVQPAQALQQRGGRPPVAGELVGNGVDDAPLGVGRADGAHGVAAHRDRLGELAAAERAEHVQADAYRAGAVTVDDDVGRRAVEVLDVTLHPVEGGDLIEYAVVAGRLGVGRREESQDV